MNQKEVKKVWSKEVNNKSNHPTKDKYYGNKVKGKLNAKHYIMYNAIRGLRLDRGFEQCHNYWNFDYHINTIKSCIKYADKIDRYNERLVVDLKFFGISIDDFKEKWDEALRIYCGS